MNRKRIFSWVMAAGILSMMACEKKEEPTPVVPLEVQTTTDLHTPGDEIDRQTGEILQSNPFVKFNIEQNSVVDGDNWDIGFKGTTIIVNGGNGKDEVVRTGSAKAYVSTGLFQEMNTAPGDELFVADTEDAYAIPTGSGNGWYLYDGATMTISPIAGKVIFLKTHDGKYAKMEILSYYKGSPEAPNAFVDQSATYTFRYVYQPDGSKNLE